MNSLTKTRVLRVMAIFLLVYTGVDLTVPGVCSEEFSAPGIVEVSVAANSPAFPAVFASINPQRNFPQDQGPSRSSQDDDDCFCCSVHVLRGNSPVVVAIAVLVPFVSVPFSNSLHSPAFKSLFHPPRYA